MYVLIVGGIVLDSFESFAEALAKKQESGGQIALLIGEGVE